MPEQASTEWYVVRTKPHQENTVESSLTRIGIEVLFPRIKEQRVIRRKIQQVVSPLFPGYLFAKAIPFGCEVFNMPKGFVSWSRSEPARLSYERKSCMKFPKDLMEESLSFVPPHFPAVMLFGFKKVLYAGWRPFLSGRWWDNSARCC